MTPRHMPQAAQLGFNSLLDEAEEANATRTLAKELEHLPGSMEEALPFFRALMERHHAAMVAGFESEAMELREEADRLATKLNNYEPGIMAGDDAPGCVLERLTRAEDGRRWALNHTLFLNPLNDLGPDDIAAQDVLSLPTYRTPFDDGPTLIGFFDQMKQEFVSARWLLFEGITNDAPHFSDKDTMLHDTLDDPGYSLSIEKTKLAFRSAYSLLDKVAFFLNDYLKLDIPLGAVSFRAASSCR